MITKRWIYLTAFFLISGLIDSIYLTYHHYLINIIHLGQASFCSVNAVIDCDQVAISRFSTLFEIPVSVLGFFAYLFLTVFLSFGLVKKRDCLKEFCALIYALSIPMLIFAVYEASASALVLNKLCPMCTILYGCGIGLVISSKKAVPFPHRDLLRIVGANLINSLSRSSRRVYLWPGLFAFGISLLLSFTLDYQIRAQIISQRTERNIAGQNSFQEGLDFLNRNKNKAGVTSLPSGLQYKIVTEGTGLQPSPNNSVTVHYVGRLLNGMEFGNSRKSGNPVAFALKSVIPGWREGIGKMKVGGTHILFVPPHLAYGDKSVGKEIPPDSTLIFKIELLNIAD